MWTRTIIFREGDTWYGVAIDLNIVIEDDPEGYYSTIEGELSNAISGRMTPWGGTGRSGRDLLTQETDLEYEALWALLVGRKNIPAKYEVRSYGYQELTCRDI